MRRGEGREGEWENRRESKKGEKRLGIGKDKGRKEVERERKREGKE